MPTAKERIASDAKLHQETEAQLKKEPAHIRKNVGEVVQIDEAPKANLAKAFAAAAGGKKRGAPVKRGGAALLNAFPATKKARAGA